MHKHGLNWLDNPVFLTSLYGAPLVQRASYLALHSSHFGPMLQLIMIILSLTALTLGSRCIPNGAHTNQQIKLCIKNKEE